MFFTDEELIKWGWPEDVWFHVDKLSSAHVYLRLKEGETLDDVPMSIVEDAAQLVKANSITGNKMNDIDVVYTLWSNLKKTDDPDSFVTRFSLQWTEKNQAILIHKLPRPHIRTHF